MDREKPHRLTFSVVACAALSALSLLSADSSAMSVEAESVGDSQRFVSRTEAVRVDVLVLQGGRLVEGLTAEDFEVRDNDVPQRIEQIDLERLPLDVIGVFDTSGSLAGRMATDLVRAWRSVLDVLRPNDRLALLAFSSRIRLLSPLTSDRAAVADALMDVRPEGRTRLRDGVFAGMTLRNDDSRRAFLLLFSDGHDTASWLNTDAVLQAAKQTDVIVYSVTARKPGSVQSGHGKLLEGLADETGGRVMELASGRDLRSTFADIVAEFRNRYILTYQSTTVSGPGWHRIDVRLKRSTAIVKARRGYFSE